METKNNISLLKGHQESITSITYNNEKSTLISCSEDILKFWYLGTKKEIITINEHA